VSTIVVGIDGSPGSDAALRWALAEARLRGSTVRILHAYHPVQVGLGEAQLGATGLGAPAVYAADDLERLRSTAAREAQGVIDGALQRTGPDAVSGIEVKQETVEGAATQTLIEAGRSADLLVLGSRGRGGFLGLLLGSVSQQCAHHPPCPVVILPPPEDREAGS
jgi:nucleotide-binding universal stress UspA family protein